MSAVASYPSGNDGSHFTQDIKELDNSLFEFEQFVTFCENNGEGHETSKTRQVEYSERSTSDSHNTLISFNDDVTISDEQQGEPWANAAPAVQPDHFEGHDFYAELSGRAAISDSDLLSLEGITLHSPQIRAQSQPLLPSTPPPTSSRRRSRIAETFSTHLKKATSSFEKSLRSPIRKHNASPKMVRMTNHSQASIKLEADALKFKFDFEENPVPFLDDALSIGDASKTSYMDGLDDIFESKIEQTPEIAHSISQNGLPSGFRTPFTTPNLSHGHSRNTSSESNFLMTPELQHPASYWSQSPRSSKCDAPGGSNMYSLADQDLPLWWNHASTAPLAQPLPTSFHTNPQLATKSLALQLQNGLGYKNDGLDGDSSKVPSSLMIQMPGYYPHQSLGVGSPTMKQQGFTHSQPQPSQAGKHDARRHYSRASSRHMRQTSPVRKIRSHDSSDSEPASPKTFRNRKRKSSKNRKYSTLHSSTFSGGTIDFVNYTPNDSRKILTGVAPSGSSKTKTRREKEALEKRRKLSQAALKAVKEAGGDVEGLLEQELFV